MVDYNEYALRGMRQELDELDRKRAELLQEIDRLESKTGGIRRMNMTTASVSKPGRGGRRQMSPEGRQRLIDSQKARWARKRAMDAVELEKANAARIAEEEVEHARKTMPRHRKGQPKNEPQELVLDAIGQVVE
jgi:hypothetical protein